jgi:CRP-like cAMP-binding protein
MLQVDRDEVIEIFRHSHIFHQLPDEKIEDIAGRVEAFLYIEEQPIFEQDTVPESFYFIFRGRVKLVRKTNSDETTFILDTRDYFGQEVLADRPGLRKASAIAVTNVIVLRFSSELLTELKKETTGLSDPFEMILNSYNLTMQLPMPWRGPREIIHFLARHHPIFLFIRLILPVLFALTTITLATYLEVLLYPGAIIPLVILILAIIINAAWLAWVVIDFYNDYSVVTNRRVAFLRKVLLIYDSRQEAPLDAILSDDISTSLLGRIIGYGDIIVRSYTGEIVLSRLAHPQLILNLINEMRDRAKFIRQQARLETIDQTIRRRIGLPLDESTPGQTSSQRKREQKQSKLSQFLSDFLKLRVEKNGEILYRTHWFILIGKTGVPALLTLALFIFLLLSLFRVIPVTPLTALLATGLLSPFVVGWLVYQYIDWRNDRYIITKDVLIDIYKKPLGTEQKRTAPLRNILSIDFERIGIIGRIFNYGTVYIRVGDSVLTFDNIMSPSEVQRELFSRFMEYKQREEERQETSMNEQLADWIEHYHRLIQKAPPPQNPPETGGFSG